MAKESFQPISVKSPNENPFLFKLRCFIDLQLSTIVSFLKPAISSCFRSGFIIDVGAGESPWKSWLPDGCNYQGIDIRNANEFGMSQRGLDVLLYDGNIMPFDNDTFDGAMCIEVLEHAKNPDLLISEIERILKPGSKLLLTVPWSARRHHIPHDYHRFTRERLHCLLSDHGFGSISIYERGNDYCAIANKLLVILIRNIKNLSFTNFLYKIPLFFLLFPIAITMLLIAQISLLFDNQNNEDPLGYACYATKKIN